MYSWISSQRMYSRRTTIFGFFFAVDICESIFRYKQVTNIINSLAIEAAAPKGTVIERKNLAELMEVAKSASDSDIDLVIEMLKRMNSKTI